MRRLLLAAVATSVLLGMVPADGSAKRIGPKLAGRFLDALTVCTEDPFCTRAQVKVAGSRMTAPFSGEIRKWRVTQPNGTLWLQVLRRRENGSYKSVRSGDPHTVTSSPGEIVTFSEDLAIRRGNYIGVGTEDFFSSSLGLQESGPRTCTKGFVPGLADGESGFPNPKYGSCTDLLLYNATLRR